MRTLTQALKDGNDLKKKDVTAAAEALLDEEVNNRDKGAFLTALAEKGETPDEIAAFVQVFLKHAVDSKIRPASAPGPMIDVCGTGGDSLDLFNISTAATFILAAGGAAVVKHGNRAVTSKSGGMDVLEALGVPIDLTPTVLAKNFRKHGLAFMFAPQYHPAFKAVVQVRKNLAKKGIKTIFNKLGPLLNPAKPAYQLLGVYDPALVRPFAEILQKLGRKGAWVVHGSDEEGNGMDEISIMGMTRLSKFNEGDIMDLNINPRAFGIPTAKMKNLKGGDAKVNAKIIMNILDGTDRGAKRDMVAVNAGAGFVITGIAPDFAAGVALAKELLISGEAMDKLKAMQS